MKPIKTVKKVASQVQEGVTKGVNAVMDTSVGRVMRDKGNVVKQKVSSGVNVVKNSAVGQTIQAAGTGAKETAKAVVKKVVPRPIKIALGVMKGFSFVKNTVGKAVSSVKNKILGRPNEIKTRGEDADLESFLNSSEAQYYEDDPFNPPGKIYQPTTVKKKDNK
jgi:hypothetical protein